MFRKFPVFCTALLALGAGAALANNVVVLPTFNSTTGSSTGNAIVFSGSPLAQVASFPASTEGLIVLSRPTNQAGDVKYYVVGRSTIQILNGAFAQIGPTINLSQTATAAAMSPDGRRLLVVAGDLKVYNTETDTLVQPGQTGILDVGFNPEDIAISQDSRRAFVISSGAQRVTVIDLVNTTTIGQIPLPGLIAGQGTIAAGPNGMIYVTALDRVLEIDPRGTNFDSSSVRRQFPPLTGARVGKLHFTPDGTRALAVNHAPQSGQLLFLFNLDFRAAGVSSVATNEPGLGGFLFDKIFIGENNRAFVTTASTSAQPRKLFAVTLPDPPLTGAQIGPPTLTEAFFGSLGNIPIVDSIAFSGERPNASRMFVSAPLSILTSAATNTLYVVNLATANVVSQITLTDLPGSIHFSVPASTVTGDPAGGRVPINGAQPNLSTGARSLPFGVRVIGTSGQPLFNFPVTFTTTTPGVTFDGPVTVNTNANGIALITMVAPATAGDVTVTAAAGNFSAAFTFTVGTSTPGGGGTPGGGTPGQAGIAVLAGEGQIAKDGDVTGKPIVIEVRDASGNVVPNIPVTWTVTQGRGGFESGNVTEQEQQRITTTDARGRSENRFRAGFLPNDQSFATNVVTITAAGSTATVFTTTIRTLTNDGNPAPFPSAVILTPEVEPYSIVGKTGQTIPGAIRLRVNASTGPGNPAIPHIGISVRVPGEEGKPETDNDPTRGPAVSCGPKNIALTNDEGVAVCDLMITGRVGSTRMILSIAGFTERTIILRVDPGEPSRLTKANGDNQAANANETLLAPLVVTLDDGGGNVLPGHTINWTVISGSATLSGQQSTTTVTNSAGQASMTVRLGTQPGAVQIRATAVGGSQPSVTFNAQVRVTVAALTKVSGDLQTAFTNTNFSTPLVVEVRDTNNVAVSGQTITFAVTSGNATLTSNTAVTDSNGRALTQVRAGANAGPIVITAIIPTLPAATFTLTAQLPGPIINSLDFFNAASGERGAVVPGGLYTVVGQGLAPDLRGCVTANTVLGQWPTRLNGIEMQFGSTLAPILNVCNLNNRQSVTFQAPFDLAPGGVAAVTVRVGTGSSVINSVQVLDLQPGVFETVDGQNRNYAVAIRPNGSYVTPENPARYGEVIRIFITGAAQVTPGATTGVTGIPGQSIVAGVVVGLNDTGVRLVSATYMENMVGVYEIAFEVPQGTAPGAARPLGVLMVRPNGQFVFPSNAPTIAVAP